jgi:hypothetical protein
MYQLTKNKQNTNENYNTKLFKNLLKIQETEEKEEKEPSKTQSQIFKNYKKIKIKIKSKIQKHINSIYNSTILRQNNLILERLMFNKSCHIVCVFKDYMIYDYIYEFLRRFYNINEVKERLLRISTYYKNYLTLFCKPTLRHSTLNSLIHVYSDNKAECYYKVNYGTNKLNEVSQSETVNQRLFQTIFNTTVKNTIDRNTHMSSIINHSNINNESIQLLFNKSYMKNDLITNRGNENSIAKIVYTMTCGDNDEGGNNVLQTSTSGVRYLLTESQAGIGVTGAKTKGNKLANLYSKMSQNLSKKLEFINISKEKKKTIKLDVKKNENYFRKLLGDTKINPKMTAAFKANNISSGLSKLIKASVDKNKNKTTPIFDKIIVNTEENATYRLNTDDNTMKITLSVKMDKISRNEDKVVKDELKDRLNINNLNININNHYNFPEAIKHPDLEKTAIKTTSSGLYKSVFDINKLSTGANSLKKQTSASRRVSSIKMYSTSSTKNTPIVTGRQVSNFNSYLKSRQIISPTLSGNKNSKLMLSTINNDEGGINTRRVNNYSQSFTPHVITKNSFSNKMMSLDKKTLGQSTFLNNVFN